MGYRPEGSNPCRGIRRYRRKGRERFLSDDEIRRLSATLSVHAGALASAGRRHPPSSADGMPQERDPDPALVGLPRRSSVPPRQQDGPQNRVAVAAGPECSRWHWSERAVGCFRRRARVTPRSASWLHLSGPGRLAEAGLRDVRLHDLRHTHASLALRQGETVLAIGRLLGHRSPATTLKYTHPADAMVHEAAETVGAVLGEGTQLHPFDAPSGRSSG